ncbi:hypothetical protein [Mastigocoleus testarum]|uniref:Uncharacterized protein n=1 Tax=Mastigocoleus testarum BC008 TaxID=371196 RepID=A0A0V7ZLY2_9CYAN|nr:hypothetical protein [Mastigocoleus testarum]KST65247.1 hypothetical protein BC008_20870 [Mastigocoleus testarum BC008]
MSKILIEPLNFKNHDHLFQLHRLETRQDNLSKIDDAILKQVYGGGRLPDANELAVIVALRNTDPSRILTGAILDDKSISINIAVFEAGSSGNTSHQING